MYIKKRYHHNILKNIFSFLIIIGFGYIIIYSDKFEVEEKSHIVKANNLNYEISNDDSNGLISLNEHIIFNEGYDKFIYIVQPGDNLSSIAYLFGTTTENIKKVNNIKGNSVIKPGQKLTISQEEGVIYEVKENTNLKSFAEKYKLNKEQIEEIIALNYLSDENYGLIKGEEIFIPITEEEAKKIGLKTTIIQPQITNTPKNYNNSKNTSTATRNKGDSILSQWHYSKNIQNGFYRGHCTRYVAIKKFPYQNASKQTRLWGGNANKWYSNAKAAGYNVGSSPTVGSIVVLKYGGAYFYSYGHVGIVLDVDWKNKKILIEDMNARGRFIVTKRRISMDNKIIGYIYL